ncbi:hypothetical protein ACFPM7_04525 [Actinokineospora guangxiensis]|uniref:Uncharacterized protein n=1 Tax=Actinokineospora guangxiensis TaxID=1490288 RepID=A0ABW0EJG5_9PSEU
MRWLVVPVALFVAACSQPSVGTEESADGRDPAAVVAALRPLDPCALIGGGERLGPHRCTADGAFTGDALRVDIGVWDDPATPVTGERLDLAGSLGLRRKFDDSCVVDLPAGADLVIRFTYQGSSAGTACTEVTEAATAAVTALADPPRVAAPHLDACTALTRSGADLGDLAVRFSEVQHGLDLCQARADVEGGWETRYSVQLLDGDVRPGGATVAGAAVEVRETGDSCEYTWSVQPGVLLRLSAPDCAETETLATTLVPIAADPADAVEPQHPITLPAAG